MIASSRWLFYVCGSVQCLPFDHVPSSRLSRQISWNIVTDKNAISNVFIVLCIPFGVCWNLLKEENMEHLLLSCVLSIIKYSRNLKMSMDSKVFCCCDSMLDLKECFASWSRAVAFCLIVCCCFLWSPAGDQVLRPCAWQVALLRNPSHLLQALPASEHRAGDLPRLPKWVGHSFL